jgi:plasmid replication initiation protein
LRLQGTQIRTNIETGGEGEDGSFSWLSDFKIQYRRNERGDKEMRGVTVEICDWLFRAIVKDQHMLTYDPQYFQLGPMERRIYEVARAHCGNQNSFRINLQKLQRRVGSDSPTKLFKSRLVAMSKRNQVPGYAFILWDPRRDRLQPGSRPPRQRMPAEGWQVFFFRKDRPGSMSLPESAPLVEDS